MIAGRLIQYDYPGGGKMYVGTCEVLDETVTAGECMVGELPPGPLPGFERVTLEWHEGRFGNRSTCDFRVIDRRHGQLLEPVPEPELTVPVLVAGGGWQRVRNERDGRPDSGA